MAVTAVIGAPGPVKTVSVLALSSIVFISLLIFGPQVYIYAFVAILGALPFASVGVAGLQLPVAVALAPLALLGAAVSRSAYTARSRGWPAVWIIGLLTAAVSFAATRGSFAADDQEFTKWVMATMAMPAIALAQSEMRYRAAQVFGIATTAGSVFAIAAWVLPNGNAFLGLLQLFGYARSADNVRYFILDGSSAGIRLTGSYVDPNIAGLFFVVGLACALVSFTGFKKWMLSSILIVGVALSLSRGAILACAISVVCFMIFANARFNRRLRASVVLIVAALAIAVFPTLQTRLSGTLGDEDIGSADRIEALNNFTDVMSGKWAFGLGWGRPEFRDAAASYSVNMVANAPLAVIYRAGIFAFVGYALLVILLSILALRLLRSAVVADQVIGAVVVGVLFVIQTGYATVILAPVVSLFYLFAGFAVGGFRVPMAYESSTRARAVRRYSSAVTVR